MGRSKKTTKGQARASQPKLKKVNIAELNQTYEQIVNEQQKTFKRDAALFHLRELGQPKLLDYPKYLKYQFALLQFRLRAHPKILATAGIVGALVFLFFALQATVLPQTVNFSFDKKQSCIFSPTLLPSVFKYDQSNFELSRPATVTIAGFPIFSSQLCVAPKANISAQTNYQNRQTLTIFKTRLITKNIRVYTGSYSALISNPLEANDEPMAILTPISFGFSQSDEVFNYALVLGDKLSVCSQQDTVFSCSLIPLGLNYENSYELKLVRLFKQNIKETIWQGNITTISAVDVINSSIGNATTVYDSPDNLTLETNKSLTSVKDISMEYSKEGSANWFPIDTSFKDKLITVKFNEPLIRRQTYNLRITDVTATDKSRFEQPYVLNFVVSGGPKVNQVSIPSSGVEPYSNIWVNFDQSLDNTQDISQLVSLQVDGTGQDISLSISGNSIDIDPKTNFPICAAIKVTLKDSIKSQYGISGDSAYVFDSRATCHTTYSIGTSVQGRSIYASRFGSASKMILFVGAMHGNEANSKVILEKWIAELDANPDKIPSGTSLIIIPATNPDGLATYSRLNTNGINLNRNFPTDDWSSQVTEPNSEGQLVNTGGDWPLSEPESAALADFVQTHDVRFVVTYHSQAGLVQSNVVSEAETVGKNYANRADYWFIPAESIGNVFDYSISGAFEDWLGQKLGIPALLVELESSWHDEFWRNKDAMWDIANL